MYLLSSFGVSLEAVSPLPSLMHYSLTLISLQRNSLETYPEMNSTPIAVRLPKLYYCSIVGS